MISSRRSFLKGLFVAPAIVAATNIMPVKVIADLLVTETPGFRVSPGVYPVEIDVSYRLPQYGSIDDILNANLYEPNDAFTRARIRAQAEAYYRDLQARNEISDYTVVCDQFNNPPYLIDQNQLAVDVYIKPNRSIQYISLNHIMNPTGIDLKTIVGTFD